MIIPRKRDRLRERERERDKERERSIETWKHVIERQ